MHRIMGKSAWGNDFAIPLWVAKRKGTEQVRGDKKGNHNVQKKESRERKNR